MTVFVLLDARVEGKKFLHIWHHLYTNGRRDGGGEVIAPPFPTIMRMVGDVDP